MSDYTYKYKIGDKVIVTDNKYAVRQFIGELGTVIRITNGFIRVKFLNPAVFDDPDFPFRSNEIKLIKKDWDE